MFLSSRSFLFSSMAVIVSAAGCDSGPEPMAGNMCPVVNAQKAETPAALAPPADSRMFLGLYAEGTQIYTCKAGMDGSYAWTFKAPSATLYDDHCAKVGTHFAGPTWQIDSDGSAVVGAKLAEAPSPGSIPQLLLKGTPKSAEGTLGTVTHIQRLATTGGLPPTDPCDATKAGVEIGTPYTATYLFYRAP
jgi:hypothetical protein